MNTSSVLSAFTRLWSHKAQAWPRLRWFASNVQRALGSRGLVALLVIVAALATQLGVINPGNESIAMRQQEALAGIAAKPDAVQSKEPATVHNLPNTDSFNLRVEAILSTLQNNRFLIQETHFQYAAFDKNNLQRVEMDIPMFGTYPMLREVLPLLLQQPAVRIENISIERKNIGESTANIRLKLSLLGVRK